MAAKTHMVLREDEDGSIVLKARTGCRHRDMRILLLLLKEKADVTTELININQKSTIHAVHGNIGEIRKVISESSEFTSKEPYDWDSCRKEDIDYTGPSAYGTDGELRHALLSE